MLPNATANLLTKNERWCQATAMFQEMKRKLYKLEKLEILHFLARSAGGVFKLHWMINHQRRGADRAMLVPLVQGCLKGGLVMCLCLDLDL